MSGHTVTAASDPLTNQTVQITEPHTRSSTIQEPYARTTTATSVPIEVPQQRKRPGGRRCNLQGGLGRRGQRLIASRRIWGGCSF
ncbi:hypothetical protein MTO96_029645 [Rhipicephalus appendiculatus]